MPFPTTGSSEDTRYGMELVLAGVDGPPTQRRRPGAIGRDASSRSGERTTAALGGGTAASGPGVHHPVATRPDPASLDAALHLATPPLAVAVMLLVVAAVLGGVAGASAWCRRTRLGGLYGIDVIVALVVARAGARAWAALVMAPAYIVWKVVLQFRAIGASRIADQSFEPTIRT